LIATVETVALLAPAARWLSARKAAQFNMKATLR
jgi:hypothetical protein